MLHSEILRDPYSAFKWLRRESPVCKLEPESPWLISRYTDVLSVLRDPNRFRSGRALKEPTTADPTFLLRTRGLVGEDPPEHTRLRSLIKNAFSPVRLRVLEKQIRSLARRRVDGFVQRKEFEFVGEFAKPFPMEVITAPMGAPLEKARDFERWASILVTWGSSGCDFDEKEITENATEMHDYFTREIAERSRKSGDDLISILSRGIDENEKMLTSRELVIFLRLLIVAGSETTTHLMSNTILALHNHAGLWRAVQNDRSLIPNLIEESLRYDSPVPGLIRWAVDDTSIEGVKIRKNEPVLALVASANHDETVFVEPERFDLHRPSRPHLSFGAGPHSCMGVMLARLQVRIVFEELFDAFSKIELLDKEPINRVESFFVRGPTSLSLRINPRS